MDNAIYVQGIAGTFMGGIAQIALESGIEVSGSDSGVYPPMSTLLQRHGIPYFDTFSADNLRQSKFDRVIVGNVMTRGMEEVEYLLDQRLSYCSGPQWLGEHIIGARPVLAVAGTHGKTTTASMCAHILEQNALNPGFLIGGKPGNFEHSARLGNEWFVIEADEYDCAFFDKRSKFVHYRPKVAILNNLEFDHADIFDSLADIERQFHHMVRTIAQNGCLIVRKGDTALQRVLAMGSWTPIEYFGLKSDEGCRWQVDYTPQRATFFCDGNAIGTVEGHIIAGEYNALNAIAAIAAAHQTGIAANDAVTALASFIRPRKRQDILANNGSCIVIEDFAHHPTAIGQTLINVRQAYPEKRVVAVIEKGSNSMAAGEHDEDLRASYTHADETYLLDIRRDNTIDGVVRSFNEAESLLAALLALNHENTCFVFMSNRSFCQIPSRFSEHFSLKCAQKLE